MQIKLVFFGSAPFSVRVLEKLLEAKVPLVAVVTQPDKPAGRHLKLTPNPVKTMAQQHYIPVFTDIKEFLTTDLPSEAIGLVAAYGRILGPKTLSKFSGRMYNIHPSLLPKYRGPSPLQQQILDNTSGVGVTILKVDLGEDTGPIMMQVSDQLLPTDTTTSLGNRLFDKGVDLFLGNWESILTSPGMPQDNAQATDTRRFTRQDGFVPWEEFKNALDTNPHQLDTKFRALSPWPGIWTIMPSHKRLKLISLFPSALIQGEGESVKPWNSLNFSSS